MDDATRLRLAKLKSECGCNAGAAGLLVFVGTYVAYATWLDPARPGLAERVAIGVVAGLVGMLVGKLLGVTWARLQYRQLLSASSPATSLVPANDAVAGESQLAAGDWTAPGRLETRRLVVAGAGTPTGAQLQPARAQDTVRRTDHGQ